MTKILDKFFPETVDKYLEVFTGGASVLLYIIQKYNPSVIYANDIDEKLINFYNNVKNNPSDLINECLSYKHKYDSETFRDGFKLLNRDKASDFFVANKTSFSGLNHNYSKLAYDKNFTINSINQINNISGVINNVNFLNLDFIDIDQSVSDIKDYFIYLDPPYYSNKNTGLYGDKGKLHKDFDHMGLFKWVEAHSKDNKIMLSYDDCPYIRELYKDYYFYNFDFVYSMTNTGGNDCKEGKEIVITNYPITI